MEEEKIQQLSQLFSRQITLYEDMLSTAKEQQELIKDIDFTEIENIDKLNRLLLNRQEQMNEIEQIGKKVQSIKSQIKVKPGLSEINADILIENCSPSEVNQFRNLLERLESILRKIAELDTATQQVLQVKLGHVREEIQKIQKGKQVSKTYNPVKQQYEGFFIDRK